MTNDGHKLIFEPVEFMASANILGKAIMADKLVLLIVGFDEDDFLVKAIALFPNGSNFDFSS